MFRNTLLATAKQRDSLLVLETIRPYAYTAKSTDSLTWHKRLGHLNEEYLNKNPIRSITGNLEPFSCETCHKKQVYPHSFSQSSNESETASGKDPL